MKCILGIDVGGSYVKYGVFSDTLKPVLGIHQLSTERNLGPDGLIGRFKTIIDELTEAQAARNSQVVACAMAFPSPLDYSKGISSMGHKLSSIKGVDLKSKLASTYDFPLFFINDAEASGYGLIATQGGESKHGIISVDIGTGLAVCTFKGGEPHALEVWNKPYKEGVLEDYISAGSIRHRYTEVTHQVKTAEEIAEQAAMGEAEAKNIFAAFAIDLGEGLAEVIGNLKPKEVIFGGGVSDSFVYFGGTAEEIFNKVSHNETTFKLADEVNLGVYGSAYYACQRLKAESEGSGLS